jgi:hypothetical protein
MLSSTYTHIKPYLPVDELSVIKSNQEHILSLSSTGFQTLLQPSGSFSPFIQILQELLSLTTEIRNMRGVRPLDNEMLSFTARRSWIEWAFSTLPSDPNSEDAELENCGIENCCRLTALIYINIVLRKMPCKSAVLSHLTKELSYALAKTNLKSYWGGKIELLTWVLLHGGAAATDVELKTWYLSFLVSVSWILGLQTWEDVLGNLNKFLWVRCDLVKRCKPLWCEIALSLSTFDSNESV